MHAIGSVVRLPEVATGDIDSVAGIVDTVRKLKALACTAIIRASVSAVSFVLTDTQKNSVGYVPVSNIKIPPGIAIGAKPAAYYLRRVSCQELCHAIRSLGLFVAQLVHLIAKRDTERQICTLTTDEILGELGREWVIVYYATMLSIYTHGAVAPLKEIIRSTFGMSASEIAAVKYAVLETAVNPAERESQDALAFFEFVN